MFFPHATWRKYQGYDPLKRVRLFRPVAWTRFSVPPCPSRNAARFADHLNGGSLSTVRFLFSKLGFVLWLIIEVKRRSVECCWFKGCDEIPRASVVYIGPSIVVGSEVFSVPVDNSKHYVLHAGCWEQQPPPDVPWADVRSSRMTKSCTVACWSSVGGVKSFSNNVV